MKSDASRFDNTMEEFPGIVAEYLLNFNFN